ncbi:HD-GYP domain-containing protein [Geoalkalibacter halelectricus]|uniref:HD domain-containing protein n=1 Tax=Geoalkalibacter halelectricus TaxID=2847045 RepID=A0ABY5ZSF9_9BACT|nr:HD domain-containing phosphohydrolase [Geoalkalibacter halelectricus]MDO3377410.1 HD domain-containing protein [Geoalkalibacter halelectricus]UWZ80830.1 HD domain-containing protein [Geoalkalibacter halelectricus]
MDIEALKQFVQTLAGAAQSTRLYPLGHPLINRQLEICIRHLAPLFTEKNTLRLGLAEGVLFCEDYVFSESNPALAEMTRLLQNLDLEGMEVRAGVTAGELAAFFALAGEGGWQAHGLERTLAEQNVRHIIPLIKEDDPRKVFSRALAVAEQICQDVALSRVPSSDAAAVVVRDMVRSTLSNRHALTALTLIKDYDNYTFQHSVNVAVIAIAVGRACGLPEDQLQILGLGGLLHDLGKLKVDIGIINKPGRLTPEEFEAIKLHPMAGASIVEKMKDIPEQVVDIVRGHHLHYNRQGYPDDLAGRPLSPLVDMAAIADAFDAMTTLRAYRRPVSPRQAGHSMRESAGSLLHPDFLEKFLRFLGPFPVGTAVRLRGGEIALVVAVASEQRQDLRLKVLFDSTGAHLESPYFLDLPEEHLDRIIGEVDPFLVDIDLGQHL